MKQLPKDLEEMLNSPEAANLLKNKEAILSLSNSPDAQKFMQLLKQTSGGTLQSAADAAMKGDPSALSKLVNEVTKTPEGAKAVTNLSQNLPK
jgi:ubiquinone biosynthesis protein Coq4